MGGIRLSARDFVLGVYDAGNVGQSLADFGAPLLFSSFRSSAEVATITTRRPNQTQQEQSHAEFGSKPYNVVHAL